MKMVVTLGIIAAGVLVVGMFLGNSILVDADREDREKKMKTKTAVCDPSHVQHWDKIAFQFHPAGGDIRGFIAFTVTDADGNIIQLFDSVNSVTILSKFDVKVLDSPDEVSNLGAKVVEKLEDFTMTVTTRTGEVISRPIQESDIGVFDVEYAIVCVAP